MSRKDYKFVWGLLLLLIGCVAALTPLPSTECSEGFVKNENGECINKEVQNEKNKELSLHHGDEVVGELSRLVANLPIPSPENVEVKPRCRLDDPNLCSKQVPATHQPSKEWIQLRDEFRRLNITFPFNFDEETEYFCCEGYERKDTESLCLPICSSKCGTNMYCAKPDLCECFEGFQKKSDELCMSETEDFKTDDPNLCSRTDEVSYVKSVLAPLVKHGILSDISEVVSSPSMRYHQNTTRNEEHFFCCQDYEQLAKGDLCQLKYHTPICAQGCPVHSSCVADGECKCLEGYTGSADSCKPVCNGETPSNSRCVRPGEWECDDGYIKVPSYEGPGFQCEPHCSKSCTIFAECVRPNECECKQGYISGILEDLIPNEKVPICTPNDITTSTTTTTTTSTTPEPLQVPFGFRTKETEH